MCRTLCADLRASLRDHGTTYVIVGFIATICNTITFYTTRSLDVPILAANTLAFLAGGQVGFVLHDRITFRTRHPSLTGIVSRWYRFVVGNFVSLGANVLVATLLVTARIQDNVVYVSALVIGGCVSYSWNNFVSHGVRRISLQEEDL